MFPRVAGAVCAIGLALAAPRSLASQSEPDSIVVHSISAAEPLRSLLTGVSRQVKGAFGPDEAERVHREIWGLAGATRHGDQRQQIVRSYSYLARDKDEREQALLGIRLLSTQPYLFDVRLRATPRIMKAIRAVVAKMEVDPLEPIDRVRLVLNEEKAAYQPRLVLSVETVRHFGCPSPHIDHELRQEADTLRLDLHGVRAGQGICPGLSGPATISRQLGLGNREYMVYVTYGDRTDRLFFDITDSMTVVTGRDSTLVEADERPRLRYRRNSFAFRCANMPRALGLCNEVDFWLAQQRGISRYDFPEGGINPYRPDPAGRPDEGIRFFQYDTPTSFEYLRICFEALNRAVPSAEGVTLTLEDWLGNSITATARPEIPGRYSHRDVAGQVAGLPACHTPSRETDP